MFVNKKESLLIFLLEIDYGKLVKRDIDDIKSKIFSIESGLYTIILLSENTAEKKIRYIISVSYNSSVEVCIESIKCLIEKYKSKISIEVKYPKRNQTIEESNSYSLVLKTKERYTKSTESLSLIMSKLENSIKKESGINIHSVIFHKKYCIKIEFTIHTFISVESVVEIIKQNISKILKDKSQRTVNACENNYLCTNYFSISCDFIMGLEKLNKTQKDMNEILDQKFSCSNVLVEQFSLLG